MDTTEMQNAGSSMNQEKLKQNKMKRSDISKSQQRSQRPENQSKQIEQLKLNTTHEFDSSKRLERVIDQIISQKLKDDPAIQRQQIETPNLHSNYHHNDVTFKNQEYLDSNQAIKQQNLNETDKKISYKSSSIIKSLEMNQYKVKDYNERFKSPQQVKRYSNLMDDELQAQPYQIIEQFSHLVNLKNIDILSSPDNEVEKQNIQQNYTNPNKQIELIDSVYPKSQKQNSYKAQQNIYMETNKLSNYKYVNEKIAFELKNNIKSAERHLNTSHSQSRIQNVIQKNNIMVNNELKKKDKVMDWRNAELEIKKVNRDDQLDKKQKYKKSNKMYLYHVYKGNYPHHIEKALEIRGVWKKIDVQALFSLQKQNLQKLSQKEQNKLLLSNILSAQQSQQDLFQKGLLSNDPKLKFQNIKSPKADQSKYKLDSSNKIQTAQGFSKESGKEEYIQKGPLMNLVANIRQYQNIQDRTMANIDQYEEQIFKRNFNSSAIQFQKEEESQNLLKQSGTSKQLVDQINFDQIVIEKSNFIWKPFNYYEKDSQKLIDKRIVKSSQMNPLVFNHFEVLKNITTKSGLVRSLKQYYRQNQNSKNHNYNEFDTTPTTFLVQAKVHDENMNELISRYKQIQKGYAPKERMPVKHCISNMWLVKPTNMNQGRGIEIFQELDKMIKFIDSRPVGTLCVVQKYIERPLLYKGRKFDIRIWAVATAKNEVYFYKQGYLRTSSSTYTLENQNYFVHLTNQCMQIKNKDDYAKFEEGNTLSYQQFQDYLDSDEFKKSRPDLNINSKNRIIIERDFIPRMKDIIIDSFCAVKNQLNPNHRKNHFEFFGYDFMIDEDFRVWLIEINTNPYIGTPNEYTKDLVPNMIDEMLNIVLDPVYPPSKDYLDSIQEKERNFEIIYQEGWYNNQIYRNSQISSNQAVQNDQNAEQQGYLNQSQMSYSINQRRAFNHCLLYPIEWHNHQTNFQQVSSSTMNKRMATKSQIKNNIVIEGNTYVSKNLDLSQLRQLYINQSNQKAQVKCIHQDIKGFQCDSNTCTQKQFMLNNSKSRRRKNMIVNRFSLQASQNNILKVKKKNQVKANIMLQTEKKRGKGIDLINEIDKKESVIELRANSEVKNIHNDFQKKSTSKNDSDSERCFSLNNNKNQINRIKNNEISYSNEIYIQKKRKKSVQLTEAREKRFYSEFMKKLINKKQRQSKAFSGQAIRTPKKNHFNIFFEDDANKHQEKSEQSKQNLEETQVFKKTQNIILNSEQLKLIYKNQKFGNLDYLSDNVSLKKLNQKQNGISLNKFKEKEIQSNEMQIEKSDKKNQVSSYNEQNKKSTQKTSVQDVTEIYSHQEFLNLQLNQNFVNFKELKQVEVNLKPIEKAIKQENQNLENFNLKEKHQKNSLKIENIDLKQIDVTNKDKNIQIIKIQKVLNKNIDKICQIFSQKIQSFKLENEAKGTLGDIINWLIQDIQSIEIKKEQGQENFKNDDTLFEQMKQFLEDDKISISNRFQCIDQIILLAQLLDQTNYSKSFLLFLHYLDFIVYNATFENFQQKNGKELKQMSRRPYVTATRNYNSNLLNSQIYKIFENQLFEDADIDSVIDTVNTDKNLRLLMQMHAKYRKQTSIQKAEIQALEIMDLLEEILVNVSCFRVNSYPIPVLNSSFISGKYYKNIKLADNKNIIIDKYQQVFSNSIKNGLILYLIRCANQAGEVWQTIQKNMQIQEFQQILKIERISMHSQHQQIDPQILNFIKEGYQIIINQEFKKKPHTEKQFFLTNNKSQIIKDQENKKYQQRSTSQIDFGKYNDSQFSKISFSEIKSDLKDYSQQIFDENVSSQEQQKNIIQNLQNKNKELAFKQIEQQEQNLTQQSTTPYFDFLLQNNNIKNFEAKQTQDTSQKEVLKEPMKDKIKYNQKKDLSALLSPKLTSGLKNEQKLSQLNEYCENQAIEMQGNKSSSTFRGQEIVEMLTNIESLQSIHDIKDEEKNINQQNLMRKEKKLAKQAVNKTLYDFNEKAKHNIATISSNQAKSDNRSKINNNQSSKSFVNKNSIVSINSKSAMNGVKNYLNNLNRNEDIQKQKKKVVQDPSDIKIVQTKQFLTPQPQKKDQIKKKYEICKDQNQASATLKMIQSKIVEVDDQNKRGRSTFKIQSSDYHNQFLSIVQHQKSFKNLQPVIKQDLSASQQIEIGRRKIETKILKQAEKGRQPSSIGQPTPNIKSKLIYIGKYMQNGQNNQSINDIHEDNKVKKQKTIT